MLLTISTTHQPATDLGYLLHKNPSRPQSFDLSFGKAHVFYPQADETICTAVLMLEIDPVGLVRDRKGPPGEGFALEQYVNDRPYTANSLLSVAISQVFGSALTGTSRERAALADTPISLTASIPAIPARGGEVILRDLFEPLGYTLQIQRHPLDAKFPKWGEGCCYALTLSQKIRLHELLSHLYVLVPVLDDDKHYWVGDDEIDKLLRHGEGWLKAHPKRDLVVRRYLRHRKHLERQALARLLDEPTESVEEAAQQAAAQEQEIEQKISLNDQRLEATIKELLASGARRVLDLGCSTGNLLRRLMAEKQFDEIVGVDVSYRALEIAGDKLRLDRLPEKQRKRISLLHGSLSYRDTRLHGFDSAAVIEVIEHLDPHRLEAFERVLFEFARPRSIVLTTPNVEYNSQWETLPAGAMRHRDHRFEWTREQFRRWADAMASRFGYAVRYEPVGAVHETVGPPTQMAVFTAGAS